MDPPAHLYQGRTTLDAFSADQFIGKALVINCTSLNEGEPITMQQLAPYKKKAGKLISCYFTLAGINAGEQRLILETILAWMILLWLIFLLGIIKVLDLT